MPTEVITRVQSRGQVTLPKQMREESHIAPGDLVRITVTDDGKLQIAPAGIKPLEYFWEKFAIEGPFDVEAAVREAEEEQAQRFWDELGEY
ncbi:MAG: AbrB/MazE/SpoVT family DNA-binding domain-containing protein [Thermomicrobiales bacterium]|nr:AbrB/MazE/SpoVT family DNA-binding domain-containing protein [Thermomicrobiales bacterium]